MIGEFILTLLHAASNAHILHLQSKSYSEHMALGTFYEELPSLVDSLAEAIQGDQELIIKYTYDYYQPAETALEELQSLKQYVEENRHFSEKTNIQNEIDAIATLIDSTIYKLKFLR